MHLSGKLFQLIDNKNKTMIVEMKEPSVIPSPCCCFLHYPACILAGEKYAKTEMR